MCIYIFLQNSQWFESPLLALSQQTDDSENWYFSMNKFLAVQRVIYIGGGHPSEQSDSKWLFDRLS